MSHPSTMNYNETSVDYGFNGGPPELGNNDPKFSKEVSSEEDKDDKRAGRRKIKIEYIQDKSRRHITFSKRKAGIMKKAYELSTLTGTQVLLLVVSETGLVYTFTTPKLQPLVTKTEGKNLIQSCLNTPDENQKEESPEPEKVSEPSKEPTPVNENPPLPYSLDYNKESLGSDLRSSYNAEAQSLYSNNPNYSQINNGNRNPDLPHQNYPPPSQNPYLLPPQSQGYPDSNQIAQLKLMNSNRTVPPPNHHPIPHPGSLNHPGSHNPMFTNPYPGHNNPPLSYPNQSHEQYYPQANSHQ